MPIAGLTQETEIIIADDVLSARKILARILNKLGFSKLTECKNAAEVIGALEKNPKIGLIISDRMMPDINGIDLLKNVRSQSQFKQLPFLLISSSVTAQDTLSVHSCGVADILLKPFTSNSLGSKLEQLCSSPVPAGEQVK